MTVTCTVVQNNVLYTIQVCIEHSVNVFVFTSTRVYQYVSLYRSYRPDVKSSLRSKLCLSV